MNTQQIKRGDKISYDKEIMFKGTERVKATVVAIKGRVALLDNGDEIFVFYY